MNLVELIKDQLTGDVLSKLSTSLGSSQENTKTAAFAAVPALLELVRKQVTKPGGADILSEILKKTDLGGILKSDPQGASKKGGDILGSLLGGGVLSTIVAALAKFSGLEAGSAKGLLGFLLPFILNVISGQLKGGPTAQGLTSLFREQEANITQALPKGLALPDLASAALPAAGGLPAWALPLAAVVLLGLAAWYLVGGSPAEPEVAAGPGPEVVAGTPAPAPAPAADAPPSTEAFAKDLGGVFNDATNFLVTVKDPATADSALPKLEGLNATIEKLKGLWDKFSPEGRKVIVAAATQGLTKLKELTTKVLEIPGLSDQFKKFIEAMLAKLGGFATA
jgi:hypothetical protein